jgi:hypothetical protein
MIFQQLLVKVERKIRSSPFMIANNFTLPFYSVEPTLAHWRKRGLELRTLPDYLYEIDQTLSKMIEISKREFQEELIMSKQQAVNIIERALKSEQDYKQLANVKDSGKTFSGSYQAALPAATSLTATTTTATKMEHIKTKPNPDQPSTLAIEMPLLSFNSSLALELPKPSLQPDLDQGFRGWSDLNDLAPSEGFDPIMSRPDKASKIPNLLNTSYIMGKPYISEPLTISRPITATPERRPIETFSLNSKVKSRLPKIPNNVSSKANKRPALALPSAKPASMSSCKKLKDSTAESAATLDNLAVKMTCTGCKHILTPSAQYKCRTGHIFCGDCKGKNKTRPDCLKCKTSLGKKHKLLALNPHIDFFLNEACLYIQKCKVCQKKYFNLGNGLQEHLQACNQNSY